MLSPTTLLYALCFLLLPGMAAFVLLRNPRSFLHQSFALTALSLLGWLATLFFFNRAHEPATVLLLGRVNFAAVVFVVFLAYLFVRSVARQPLPRHLSWLVAETLLLAVLSAFTPLIDQAEMPSPSGRHTTVYGPLFPLYILHVLGYLAAAVTTAFGSKRIARGAVRDQLVLIGSGMLATGGVALITNVLLPYGFGNFHFSDVGTLSSILFLVAVAYAITKHHLFDIRLLVRKTLVYGLLLSFVLSAYSAVVLLVTDHLTQGSADTFTRFGVLVIAFSFDPVRRFLEKRVDRLLFRESSRRSR